MSKNTVWPKFRRMLSPRLVHMKQSGRHCCVNLWKASRIASLAKRLAAEQDVESARRAFMRLHRLMQRHADKLPESS